jgi:pimeloyl-ACP methyl ester carboxylesterase
LQALIPKSVGAEGDVFTYREAGAGQAIVFLHGISSGSGSWVHQLTHLRYRARCIAWDAPGYGGSSAVNTLRPTATDYGQALERFLNALKIERVLIVAHSLGALMATAFAAKHPGRVRGMVLLDPAIGYGASPREEAEAKLKTRLKQLNELGLAGLAETRSVALVSKDASQDAIELIQWNMRHLSPSGYTQAARMLAAADLLRDAKAFPGQVLIACGTEDTITPEDKCRRVAEVFQRGSYAGLPGLGHASYIEDPIAVNQKIDEFDMGLPND